VAFDLKNKTYMIDFLPNFPDLSLGRPNIGIVGVLIFSSDEILVSSCIFE